MLDNICLFVYNFRCFERLGFLGCLILLWINMDFLGVLKRRLNIV